MAKMRKSTFVFVDEVMATLMISKPMAYRYIKQWNKELQEMNFVTISGRVPRKYFESKIYGMLETTSSTAK